MGKNSLGFIGLGGFLFVFLAALILTLPVSVLCESDRLIGRTVK